MLDKGDEMVKKIAILALHLGYGGVEKSIVTLANLLANNPSYQVEIVSIYQLYDTSVFPIDQKVTTTYLLPKELNPNKTEWKNSLKKVKLVTFAKESMKSIKILHKRKSEMAAYLKHSDADIIISTRVLLNGLLSTYGNTSAIKIGWEHNHYHDDMKYATNVICSAKNLDYLVLVSKDLERFYTRKMASYRCKCVYIPNTLEKIPRARSPLTEKRFISVGRLSPEKGYMDLLKIYQQIALRHPDWTLDIVGDGSERKNLEAYIKKYKLSDKVVLHGFQNSDYINRLLHQSSIYIMTSFTESFGIVLLEAMSHGIPCLAFDSAEGAREIITSSRDGYLIKHRNHDMMIRKIEDLIKDENKRKELGSNARKKVIKIYSKESVLEEWLKLIEQ